MMRFSRQITRVLSLNLISGSLVIIFALHTLHILSIPLLRRFENSVYDLRMQLTLPNHPDSRIVIIDIDEKSMAREGQWPWPRNKLAYLVDILFDYYQIKLLGFDVVFSEPDKSSGLDLLESLAKGNLVEDNAFKREIEQLKESLEYDTIFARSLSNRPVVLGFGTRLDNLPSSGVLPQPILHIKNYPDSASSLFNAPRFTGNIPVLQSASATSGFFSTQSVDEDGILRRTPVLMRHEDGIYESLTLAMLRTLLGYPPLNVQLGSGYHGQSGDTRFEALKIEGFTIPVDEAGTVLIPYKGYYGSFPYFSAADVLNGEIDPDKLRGKIILIGTTAVGLLDLRATPIQSTFPGVEINANLLAGMLDQSFKQRPSYTTTLECLEILGIGIVLILVLPRCTPDRGALFTTSILILIIAGNIHAWQLEKLSMQLATPVILVFLLYANQMFFGFFLESQAKRRLTALFGQYVPSDLVSEMIEQDSDFGIGGETREMTVLFSDVRGFTSISENLSPDQLSQLMNAFLTPLTAIIHQHKGTIDKYMGDAIMAFWGAPLADPEHGQHALEAALAMIRTMEAVREDFRAKGWPDIRLGVGLNTGLMNVGNMGSRFRMAYTVLGDAVNLGSRLEGLTKYYGVAIIVSQSTRKMAPEYVFQELDIVRVKGKNESVTLFEPLGHISDISLHRREELLIYHQGLDAYRRHDWQQAESIFLNLMAQYEKRELYRLYLDRIASFKLQPPDPDWDGTYNHQNK